MPNKPPPSRLTIHEVKGRLVVIDRETGAPPLSAAERMKMLDAQAGHVPQSSNERGHARSHSQAVAIDTPTPAPSSGQIDRSNLPQKHTAPWGKTPQYTDNMPAKSVTNKRENAPPLMLGATTTASKDAQSIQTTSAWDKKGPRQVILAELGRQKMGKLMMFSLIGLFLFEIFIWSNGFMSGLILNFVLMSIFWSKRAELGAFFIDQALAADRKSQL